MSARSLVLAVSLLAVCAPQAQADEAEDVRALKKELSALKGQMAELQKVVAVLQATQPTITTIMPNFAERFHVMHYAGDAGDWAVAGHELQELQRLIGVAKQIHPNHGAMMEGFMTASLRKLKEAIDHNKREAFDQALGEAVNNCNACHAAAGSPFIKVTLEVTESLSLRHPHSFGKTRVPMEHMHKH